MNFRYMKTETFLDSIEIEDIGNCYLDVLNDEGREWLLCMNTELGWTSLTLFGPIVADLDKPAQSFYLSHSEFEYSDKKVYKTISDFINDSKKAITQVFLIDKDMFDKKKNIIKNNLQ